MKSVQGGEIFHSLTNTAVLKQCHKTLETCIKKTYFKILPDCRKIPYTYVYFAKSIPLSVNMFIFYLQ